MYVRTYVGNTFSSPSFAHDCMIKYFLGINDLQKFVDVALHTSAGEGDLANDNLSRLTTVGNGYCPLIYDLKSDSSFEDFMECCMKVWDALQLTRDLQEKLVSYT